MTISDLTISYGQRRVFEKFSVTFRRGETTVILGPSGCGKTTLLNHIAFSGLAERVSYIFQEPRLLPWMTLSKNIEMVLPVRGSEASARARYYLARVGLLDRAGAFPERLSGGERQRASIARAFAFPAPILLMDEPFQSQDISSKIQLANLVRELQTEEKRTVVSVTHDIHEAEALADRVLVLKGSPAMIVLDVPVSDALESQIREVFICQTSIP